MQQTSASQIWERRLSEQGVLSVLVRSARGLLAVDAHGKDQYVRVNLGSLRSKASRSKRTGAVKKSINPQFDCELQFRGALHDLTKNGLQLQLFDQDLYSRDDLTGAVLIEAAELLQLLTQPPTIEPTWQECNKRLDTQGLLAFSLKWEVEPEADFYPAEVAVALAVAKAKKLPSLRSAHMSEEAWKTQIEAEDVEAFGTNAPGSDAAAAASHLRGVTIDWLLEFTDLHDCWEWTTQQVVDRIIKPATAPTRCRFADLKAASVMAVRAKANWRLALRANANGADGGSPAVRQSAAAVGGGPADVYVSHCWGASWGTLCKALSDEQGQLSATKDTSAVRVWIDVLAVRLWPGNSADQALHGGIIRRCTSFVVVSSAVEVLRFNDVDCFGGLTSTQMMARRIDQLEPEFRTSIAFLRSWVLAEVLTALDTPALRGGVIVKIGRLAKRQQGYAFVKVEGMARALATIVDVELTEASLPADQEMLRREVFRARAGGSKSANNLLQRLLLTTAPLQDPASSRGELTRRGYAEEARKGATPTEQLTVWAVSAVGGGLFGVDSEALMRLLSRGAQAAAFACDGISPLMAAVENRNVDAVELILLHLGSQAPAAVNLVCPLDGQTALTTASSLGDEAMVLILLKSRADPVLPNCHQTCPLRMAAEQGKPSVVQLLLNARAKVDQRASPNKMTALHAAASAGNTETVQLLLKARAKVYNRIQPSKITALHVAASGGNAEAVQLLLEAWRRDPGKAVQQMGAKAGRDPYYFIINDRTRNGATALSLAQSERHADTIQSLLAANADPNAGVTNMLTQSLEQHINSARGMSARSEPTDEGSISARSGLSTRRGAESARSTAPSELTEEEGITAGSVLPADPVCTSRATSAISSGAVHTMALLLEQLDRHIASKDYDRAAAFLDPLIEWQTPARKAIGRAAVKATWASGVDDKWGVIPVWREVIGGQIGGRQGLMVFTRECETFRVMGWPIRLRQTFHVRKKGTDFVVLKTVIERL